MDDIGDPGKLRRFLTREEASELVRNNNQEMVVDRNAIREQLYSEDLY